MISSLKSIFDLAKRRAIFVSPHKLAVYHWQKGDLGSSYLFDTNDEGKAYFEKYLVETQKIPTYIMVDMFEEEFRRDTVPHVFGSDRSAIIERKKARLFRDTPYYHYRIQGREEEGRKDDQIMLSAITNPKPITIWVDLLKNHQIPLVGIYSISILTESILKLLPDTVENNLIVSLQSISGLRQTFITKGQLRVSRLIQMPRYGTEPYGPHIKDEVDKIKRYLNSVRLVPTDMDEGSSLNTYFILSGDVLEEVRNEYKEISTAGIRFVDINELLSKSGCSSTVSSTFSDKFFIHHLLKNSPQNVYAQSTDRKYNTMLNMRIAMLTCSILMIISSMAWSGYTFMQGISNRQNTLAAKNKSDFYTARYQIAREGLPRTPVDAADLKTAVELIDNLQTYKTTPLEMVQLISAAMNRYTSIKLGNFSWVASADPNINLGSASTTTSNQGVIGFSNVSTQQEQYEYYQVAVVDAEISPFDGNYRRAISLINEYAEIIRNQTDVYDVSIISLPLDVSSNASMSGNTSSVQREAKFSIRVVLGVNNEV